MALNVVNAPNNLRNDQVDMLLTKNNDMRQRRVINAAPAINNGDYTTLEQVNDIKNSLNSAIKSAITYITNLIEMGGFNGVVTPIIAPPSDKTSALQITKADKKTPVMNFDTINSRVGIGTTKPTGTLEVNGSIVSNGVDVALPAEPMIRMAYSSGINVADVTAYNGNISSYIPLHINGNPLTLGVGGIHSSIGFFASTPATKNYLNAYTPILPGSYTGIASGLGGSPYASVANLNSLATAVNNLRLMCEDLRTKLQNTTLVG